jgi:3-phenylpropionate/trans-cinnamate dioxygenase ferredoxin subunit
MIRVPLSPAEIAEGTMRGVRLDSGRYLLLVRLGGRLHALDDMCNHAGCLLSRGRFEAGRVVCPCHLMAFDVRTGARVSMPALCDDQRTHAVVERDGEVLVALSDA